MIESAFGYIARFTTFSAIFVALGAVVFRLYVLRRAGISVQTTSNAARRAANITMFAALAILPAAVVKLVLQTADMRFPDDGWVSVGFRMVTQTTWGTTWRAQVAFALLLFPACLYARRMRTGARVLPWIPVALLVVALAVTPSTSSHAMSAEKFAAITVYNDVVHVFAASTWLGTLFVMYRSARGGDALHVVGTHPASSSGDAMQDESQRDGARADTIGFSDADRYLPELLAVFSPLALVCGAVVAASGLIASFSHIATFGQLFTTIYGETLLAKLASVLSIALFGYRNFRYLTPALVTRGPAPMRRGMLLELAATVLVLLVTAVLVVTPPPMQSMPMN